MFAGRKSDHMDDRERSERALQIAVTVAGPSRAVGRSLSHFRPRRTLRGRIERTRARADGDRGAIFTQATVDRKHARHGGGSR